MEIIGVYHAEAGLLGELKYIAGRVFNGTHCALCDITHGWHPLGKTAWRKEKRKWGNLKAIHLDEQPPAMAEITHGNTPCVVLVKDEQFRIIMNKEQLADCQGDIQDLIAHISFYLHKSPK